MRKHTVTGRMLHRIVTDLCGADIKGRRALIRQYLETTGVRYEEQPFGRGRGHGVNFVVRLEGRSQEAVVLSAHYDGPGAYDNASGVAVVFAATVEMANSPLGHPVYACFLDREESGQRGARHFLARHDARNRSSRPCCRERLALSIAVDGCGVGSRCLAFINQGNWQLHVQGHPTTIRVPADSTAFLSSGIPSLHCCSLPARDAHRLLGAYAFPSLWRVLHTEDDCPSLLSPRALRLNATWLSGLLQHALSGHDPCVNPRAIPIVSMASDRREGAPCDHSLP